MNEDNQKSENEKVEEEIELCPDCRCELEQCDCCPECETYLCECPPPDPQYYIVFDSNGDVAGFYVDEIHGDDIPSDAIPISTEDWQTYSADASKYKLDGDVIRSKTQQELDDEAAARPPAPKTPLQKLEEADLDNKEAIASLYEMLLGGA